MCDCRSEDQSNDLEDNQPCPVTPCCPAKREDDAVSQESEANEPVNLFEVRLSKTELKLLPGESTESCDCATEESTEDPNRLNALILRVDSSENLQVKCDPVLLKAEPRDSEISTPPGTCKCSSSCECYSGKESEKETPGSCHCSESCESLKLGPKPGQYLPAVEYTLAIIKPEVMMYRKEIECEILSEGFSISQRRWLQLTPEQVTDLYLDDYKREDFARLVSYMSSGSIIVFVLSKINAIEEWKALVGPRTVADARIYAPDSIRGKYGRRGDDMRNAVHASRDKQAAEREIRFFFPDYITEPIFTAEEAVEYLWKKINDVLSDALVKCCEEKPPDPVIWLGNWLLDNNPNRPQCLSNLND